MSGKPHGYAAYVECFLAGPLDRHTYFFSSHYSQHEGVCSAAGDAGAADLANFVRRVTEGGFALFASPGSLRYWFRRYAKTHDGGWRLLRIIPVRRTKDGFVRCKETR